MQKEHKPQRFQLLNQYQFHSGACSFFKAELNLRGVKWKIGRRPSAGCDATNIPQENMALKQRLKARPGKRETLLQSC